MIIKNSADILFVIDCSQSMEPCIEGVKHHIGDFIKTFENDPNQAWDIRMDILAHKDGTLEDRAAGMDKDFRERVTKAGGIYDNVDIRASLVWHNRNDLDLHMTTPAGEEIYFGKKQSSCGGKLDVDRNVRGETTQPVENIRWEKGRAKPGRYTVSVNTFAFHGFSQGETPFKVEVVNGPEVKYYEMKAAAKGETVDVCNIDYPPASSHQAHSTDTTGFEARSIFNDNLLSALYRPSNQARFFTKDSAAFKRLLDSLKASDNECPLVALDCALDFPWRPAAEAHRIIIFLSDEPLEGGNRQKDSLDRVNQIIEKIHDLRVMLFMVTPDSAGFEQVSAANRCVWQVVEGEDGLSSVNFQELLVSMAKTISKSQAPLGTPRPAPPRALFKQDRW